MNDGLIDFGVSPNADESAGGHVFWEMYARKHCYELRIVALVPPENTNRYDFKLPNE